MYHLDVLTAPSLRTTILGVLNGSLMVGRIPHAADPFDDLTSGDIDILSRFHTRTIPTLETSSTHGLYQAEILALTGQVCDPPPPHARLRLPGSNVTAGASQHVFLMHLALGFTLMHDRHLVSSPPRPPSRAELAHFARGTALFNMKLSGTLTPSEKDAIWAAATLLGTSTLAGVDALSPEEAWPLRKSSGSDLDWLRMYDGKREIWRIADPTRPDCCLRLLCQEIEMVCQNMLMTEPGLERLPVELCRLLDLHGHANHASNPYRFPASILNNLMAMKSSETSILPFLSFITLMQADFRQLVVDKDPYALILLAYWFAEFSQHHAWFVWRRSVLECQSICLYLARHHGGIDHLDAILEHPRRTCGLISSESAEYWRLDYRDSIEL